MFIVGLLVSMILSGCHHHAKVNYDDDQCYH